MTNIDCGSEVQTYGILLAGFHQRCHVPPIPVSALELDMPWNCTYCQKGSKCPFLTESLDVLQNLLLDDEQSRDGDEESVMTVDSDQDEYGTTKSIRHKKRKVCTTRNL